MVSLTNDLHVGVLDAIVHHLHEVASAIWTDVGAARHAIDLRGDGLQQWAQVFVGLLGATGHDGGAVESTFFATGNARADEHESTLGHLALTADGVRVQGVSTIDDDIALIHGISQLVDHGIRASSGGNHDQGTTWTLQGGHEIFDGCRGHEVGGFAELIDECLGLGCGAVVYRHGVTVVSEVSRDVGAHDG